MTGDSDANRVVYTYGEQATVEGPAEKKGSGKTRRLIGVALFALILAGAAVVFAPRLLKTSSPQHPGAHPAPVASSPVVPESLPAVQDAWEQLDLGTMSAEVAQDLKSGKYYYDNRFPGNFGLAISYWKQALDSLSGRGDSSIQNPKPKIQNPNAVQTLVASAEKELARQFRADSGDVAVLLKQGKKDLAVVLLEKMRADFLDIAAPQYVWASAMLSRLHR